MEKDVDLDQYFKKLNKYQAPSEWTEFASKYGAGPVWLVDDPSLSRSIRKNKEIFINIRGNFWKNYKEFGAESYEETIVLKFLHEIGHIAKNHPGDPHLKITPDGISEESEKRIRGMSLNEVTKDRAEKEAWDFACEIKSNHRDLFNYLLNAYKRWYQSYPKAVQW